MAKKLEVRFYPRSTDPPVFLAVPLWKVFVVFFAIILAIVGYFTFDPISVLKRLMDRTLFQSYVDNKDLIKTLGTVQDSLRQAEARLKALEERRMRIIEQAGIPLSQPPAPREAPPRKRFGELNPARNMTRIRQAHATMRAFLDSLNKNPTYTATLPLIHPLVNHHRVTARFDLMHDRHIGAELPHYGIDYATFEGDTIIAPGSGMVSSIRTEIGFGLTLTLVHNPRTETFYAHLQQVLVKPGQSVRRGQPIALVGKSGRSSGPHLHYEVRIFGQPVNPADYFLAP